MRKEVGKAETLETAADVHLRGQLALLPAQGRALAARGEYRKNEADPVEVLAVYLLVGDAAGALGACPVYQEQQQVGLDALDVGNSGVDDVCRLSVAAEEAETLGVVGEGVCQLLCPLDGAVRQAPQVDEGVGCGFVVQAEDGQHALLAKHVLQARELVVALAQRHDEGRHGARPDVYGLAGEVVVRVDALGADVACLAVDRGRGGQRGVAGGGGLVAVRRRVGRHLCDARDRVLQVGQRLLRRLQLRADALPVLVLLAGCSCVCVCGPSQHLSRKGHGPAMDVHHAVGKVVSILAEAHADALCRRMRLARRMVGTQLRVLADDTCFAGDRLVALHFALAARIAGLHGISSSSWLEPSAEALACGQQTRQCPPAFRPVSFFWLAYLVLARLSLPSQDLVDVGPRWHLLPIARRRVWWLLRFAFVHGGRARTIRLLR